MNNANTIFLLLTFLLFTVIFGFGIFTDGMFFDGIIYATVANNYANGLGSFWNLYSGNTISSAYHDQPPLTFFIQAHFFKLLGDSIYVERTYDFVFAVIHLLLIKYLWQELTHKHNRFYWLPMLLWISIPLCSWTFKNNLIEVTMGAFDLAAVLFLLKGCKQEKFLLENPKRDHDLLSDLYLLQKHLPRGITISIPSELDTKWAYRAYFMRYCYVNLDANTANKYLLMEKPDGPDDACYQNLNLPLKKFSVYYCSSK